MALIYDQIRLSLVEVGGRAAVLWGIEVVAYIANIYIYIFAKCRTGCISERTI